jgi:hypothetical protein
VLALVWFWAIGLLVWLLRRVGFPPGGRAGGFPSPGNHAPCPLARRAEHLVLLGPAPHGRRGRDQATCGLAGDFASMLGHRKL